MKKLYCQLPTCDNEIDPARVAKNPEQRYCSRSCANKARGPAFFKKLSKAGLSAHYEHFAATGHFYGYQARSAAMKRVRTSGNHRKK